jgi:rhodanese-related sulfurtransferase
MSMPNGVEDLHAEARSYLHRLTPQAAADALACGAILVDIRPLEQRRAQGDVPGAAIVGRNVLERRFDPGAHRIPQATLRRAVIVFCDQGHASSLAARSLQLLGWPHATDMVGGFEAWAAAGLPVRECTGPSPEEAAVVTSSSAGGSTGEEALDQSG